MERPRTILKQSFFFRRLRGFLRKVKRHPKIVDQNAESIKGPAIFIANHSGAAGPMDLSIFFPYPFVPWGAHEMRGNYKMRWKYSYHVFYRQKLKYSKVRSFILATFLAAVNAFLYKNMHLIPTYQDIRFTKSLRDSVAYLEDGIPILIFPEDSTDGYDDQIKKFNGGIVVLADYLYKHRRINIPIYPVYYSKSKGVIEIGKPEYFGRLVARGYTREEIADILRVILNNLGVKITETETKTETE